METFELAKKVFSEARPSQFVENSNHCDECADVEKNAAKYDLDTVTANVAGGGYASFLSFLSDSAYKYYFPAFVRLCLESVGNEDNDFFPAFMFSLTYEGRENDRRNSFSKEQRQFVFQFLEKIEIEMKHEVWLWGCDEDMVEAKRIWKM